jgi:hypothetical protein
MIDRLIKLFEVFLGRVTTDNMKKVTAGSDEERADGFFLYVPIEGTVQFTTYGSQTITVTLTKGYHPIKCKKIIGAGTVVDVYITY